MFEITCGLYIGDVKWHGTEAYEPDECDWSTVMETKPETVVCGNCGSELSGPYHIEEIRGGLAESGKAQHC